MNKSTGCIDYDLRDKALNWKNIKSQVLNPVLNIDDRINPFPNHYIGDFTGIWNNETVLKTINGNTYYYEGSPEFIEYVYKEMQESKLYPSNEYSKNWLEKYTGCVNTDFHKWNLTQDVPKWEYVYLYKYKNRDITLGFNNFYTLTYFDHDDLKQSYIGHYEYILPVGYHVASTISDELKVFNSLNQACEIIEHSSGRPQIIDTTKNWPVLNMTRDMDKDK